MLHAGQKQILRTARRFNTVACGRRFGKSTMALAVAACGSPGAPGGLLQGYPVGWFAPSYKLLDEAWRTAKRFLRGYIAKVDGQQKRLELVNGAAFDFWTLEDPDAGRSRKYAIAIIDEAAMARNLQEAWQQSIRATLADYRGAAWFLSTPKGRNFFHQLHLLGDSTADWQAHHAPTSANPFIDADEIESARLSLPERVFAQEYLAQFIEDGAGVFRGVDKTPIAPWLDRGLAGNSYTIGVDWGRHEDFTVLVVIDNLLRVVHIDRFTGIGYELQTSRLIALWERFNRCPVLAESNSMGGPLIERLQRQRIPVRAFYTSNSSKASAIEALSLAIENGQLALPDDARVQFLRNELLAYESERLPGGQLRYSAPPGQHDDGVMALAIAYHGAAVPRLASGLKVAGL
jgi:hypothetical protein